jgi:hypothetical protein
MTDVRSAVLALLAVAVLLSGCSAQRSPQQTQPPVPTGSGTAAPTSPSGTPASSSSVVSPSLPEPSAIGSDWSSNPNGGDANQSPSWQTTRDPAETNTGLVPIGCSGLKAIPAFPLARSVRQGQYVSGSLNAVVLLLEYDSAATASHFMAVFAAAIAHCPAPKTVTATTPYIRAITTTQASDVSIRDYWVEYGAGAGKTTWHEVVVRNGSKVGLGDVESAPGVTPDLEQLASALGRATSR